MKGEFDYKNAQFLFFFSLDFVRDCSIIKLQM